MVFCIRKVSADRDIRPTNYLGQVSISADGGLYTLSFGGQGHPPYKLKGDLFFAVDGGLYI